MSNYVKFSLVLGFNFLICSAGNAVEYTGDSFRDPFESVMPEVKVSEKLPDQMMPMMVDPSLYRLQGIIWNPNKPQTIINGKILGVGDMVENAKILEIKTGGVTLLVGNQEIHLASK